ncbi:MAG: ParA family protein [Oscillospiraceae bacterium]|nr:ParA family protein [Oscillospiraceae bacterium]
MSICTIWGAPQSGKTTLAVNLSYAISRGNKSVCLISPVEYSELSALLGVRIPEEHSLRAALRGSTGIKQTVYRIDELFYVLAAPTVADAFDSDCTDEQVKTLLELALLTFDVVIVDCPSETNNLIAAWSLNKADTVLLCLGGHVSCALWHMANTRALQTVRNRAVYVNSEVTSEFDYDAMCRLLKCTPDIKIPYIPEAPLLQNEERLLYQMSGKKGRAYVNAINELYEAVKP